MNAAKILTRTLNDSFKGLKFSYVCEYTKETINEIIVEEIFTNNFQCESGAIYSVYFIAENLK